MKTRETRTGNDDIPHESEKSKLQRRDVIPSADDPVKGFCKLLQIRFEKILSQRIFSKERDGADRDWGEEFGQDFGIRGG